MQGFESVASGNVVKLARFQKDMQFSAVQEMIAYWEALRAGRQVPLRSEVDPRGIEGALEYAFILEGIAPGVTRFRLSGTHLNDLMGMEVRGMPLTAFITPEHRDEMARVTRQVLSAPATAEITLAADPGVGRPPLMGKLLMLPMKSDAGEINRVLGCLVTNGQAGRTPRRFAITDCRVTPLPAPAPRAGRDDRILAWAEALAEYRAAPSPRPLPQRGHLRLVKTDE